MLVIRPNIYVDCDCVYLVEVLRRPLRHQLTDDVVVYKILQQNLHTHYLAWVPPYYPSQTVSIPVLLGKEARSDVFPVHTIAAS